MLAAMTVVVPTGAALVFVALQCDKSAQATPKTMSLLMSIMSSCGHVALRVELWCAWVRSCVCACVRASLAL